MMAQKRKDFSKIPVVVMVLITVLAFTSCSSSKNTFRQEQPVTQTEQTLQPASVPVPAESPVSEPQEDDDYPATDKPRWAGIRISSYGMKRSFGEGNFPSPARMVSFADKMESCYEGSNGAHILIVGTVSEKDWSCRLAFPLSHDIDLVRGGDEDFYGKYLDAFDKAGQEVWLQVEPGDADIVELAREVMSRYSHHTCVRGFGIDVEWYKPAGTDGYGSELDNDTAMDVLTAVREIDPSYTVFVKHWDSRWLPDDMEGFIYVNDSQDFHAGSNTSALEKMADDFAAWAFLFDPCPVMFQIGYNADEDIWGDMDNPAEELGQAILDACFSENDKGIIWVDFTLDKAMRNI